MQGRRNYPKSAGSGLSKQRQLGVRPFHANKRMREKYAKRRSVQLALAFVQPTTEYRRNQSRGCVISKIFRTIFINWFGIFTSFIQWSNSTCTKWAPTRLRATKTTGNVLSTVWSSSSRLLGVQPWCFSRGPNLTSHVCYRDVNTIGTSPTKLRKRPRRKKYFCGSYSARPISENGITERWHCQNAAHWKINYWGCCTRFLPIYQLKVSYYTEKLVVIGPI